MADPLFETDIEQLRVSVYATNQVLGEAAALEAAAVLRHAMAEKGEANAIFATGNSQLTFFAALRTRPDIDWARVNVLHMDEYIGLPPGHSASLPEFLRRELLNHVRAKAFFPVPGLNQDLEIGSRQYEAVLRAYPADLCALGIGENGHMAFNDPPYADFNDPVWVKAIQLDERSRRQQVSEGHFSSLAQVPTHALTLTIPALLAAKRIVAIVPEARKAKIVERSLRGPLTPDCPASILRQTAHAHLYLDRESASLALPVP